MKMYAYRELSPLDDDWKGWKISKGKLITPDGWPLTPNRIIMGNALIEEIVLPMNYLFSMRC